MCGNLRSKASWWRWKICADCNWNSFSLGTAQPPPSTSGETLNFWVKVEASQVYPNAWKLSKFCYFCQLMHAWFLPSFWFEWNSDFFLWQYWCLIYFFLMTDFGAQIHNSFTRWFWLCTHGLVFEIHHILNMNWKHHENSPHSFHP